MSNKKNKLKRVLGFGSAYGAAVGLVMSGTAMYSVANVTGTTGYATSISAILALIPMMMAAFAFGELVAMLPGGGMISDYTAPALGKFWATFALLSGYIVLVVADGGTQLVMGGLTVETLTGVPQLVTTLLLFGIVVVINVLNVGFYGKVEAVLTVAMMVVFALFVLCGNFRVGEIYGAIPINESMPFLPEGGWKTIFGATGSAIWFYIGFEFACPMAEENRKPYKNIPYALIIGLISICVLDSLFTLAIARYTDLEVLRTSEVPQMEAAKAILGKPGYIIMGILTTLAAFTTANAYIASLPRMLYGLARENLVPKCFLRINSKTRTPVVGIIFTSCLIMITVIIVTVNDASTSVVNSLIYTASITWMISYAIAMIDVLVLRKKYPEFPRLWKAPWAKVTMPLGILAVIYSIYTLKEYMLSAIICMIIVGAYCIIWFKVKGIKINEVPHICENVANIRENSEYLPVWDEAVVEWCHQHEKQSNN